MPCTANASRIRSMADLSIATCCAPAPRLRISVSTRFNDGGRCELLLSSARLDLVVAIIRARYVMAPSRRASNNGTYCNGKITVGISSAEMAINFAGTSLPSGRG